ncbi:hypothetical protein TNCV_2813811 [Trichonephila clavipes]|nr:hypothetical protein TNCV_2813811 [Trichonephila clavipes]
MRNGPRNFKPRPSDEGNTRSVTSPSPNYRTTPTTGRGRTTLMVKTILTECRGCNSPVVKVSDHGRHVMSSNPVPLKTNRVGVQGTLNLWRAQTSSRWRCGGS